MCFLLYETIQLLKELMFVVMKRDDCTYKKEGNGDEKFCFKSSTNYASTCSSGGFT